MAELYEVLGLDIDATADAVRAALTEQRRTWRRRTTSPDIAVRQEAERRMHLLDEAERTLLDAERRAEYLARLSDDQTGENAAEGRWIVRALEQVSRGQYGAAVFTAKRAVADDPDNAYAYSVLAEAAVAAGDAYSAIEAIDKALLLEPEDARFHAQRAGILVASANYPQALVSLRTAISLDPGDPEYRVRLIHHLIEHGELDEAIAEAEQAYQTHPADGEIRTALATALAERAVAAQHELPNGRLIITSLAQASYVEALCNRGLSVAAPDAAVNADLTKQRATARRAKRRRFSWAAFRRHYRWPVGLGLLALAGVCCVPNFLGAGADASTKGLAALLALAATGAFAVSVFLLWFEPQHRRNTKLVEQVVPRRTGRLPGKAESATPTYAAVRPRRPESSPRELGSDRGRTRD